jgi:hypothetical protein
MIPAALAPVPADDAAGEDSCDLAVPFRWRMRMFELAIGHRSNTSQPVAAASA